MFGGGRASGGSASTNAKESLTVSSDGKNNASKQVNAGGHSGNLASGFDKSGTQGNRDFSREYSLLSDEIPSNDPANQLPSGRYLKPAVSGSTLHRTALQADYERGAELATKAAVQIVADKMETVDIIANYGLEPFEMLHLVDRWLQQLLHEFEQQRSYFKHRLSEKWQNQELENITYDNNDRIRRIYAACKELERAQNTVLSRESFDLLNTYLQEVNENETDELKKKFNSLAQDYLNILHCLEFVDRETKTSSSNGDHYISEIQKKLSKLKQLSEKQSHTICIVGLEKAGKSTFINALLGYELVPTAAERCTQVRTVLKPPLSEHNKEIFATVKFYNDEEFSLFHDKMPKKVDESQQKFDERKREVVTVRETLKQKFPEEHFRINNMNDAHRERTAICGQLYEYITGEVYCNIIKEISIYTDRLPGKNFELLDVPGFDSPIKEHRDAGIEAIRIADAFLFLTNGQQPNLTQPQIKLLHEIQQNHFEAMQRAFGIITKLDLCQTSTIYQDHYEKAYKELLDKKFKPERIYVACPRVQIIDKNSEEYQVITRKLKSFGDNLVDGFERSKESLNKFIEYELPKTHLKQLVELGRLLLAQSVTEGLDKIKQKQLLPQNLMHMSIDEYIQQQKTVVWDKVYDEQIFIPAFNNANYWHTVVLTQERVKFIDDARETFRNTFVERAKQFLQSTQEVERQMFEQFNYSKVQLNAHSIDSGVRQQLSFQLEKIVDETSDVLATHFYHQYVCGLEKIINDVCPHLKDLFRPKLTLEQCTNETHALVLRICRPMITAALTYSHLDHSVKLNAINDLIYIAPTVAYNIAMNEDENGSSGAVAMDIHKSIEYLSSRNEMTTMIIRTLFNK